MYGVSEFMFIELFVFDLWVKFLKLGVILNDILYFWIILLFGIGIVYFILMFVMFGLIVLIIGVVGFIYGSKN